MADPLVSADDLQAYCAQLLGALGVPPADAAQVAETLVEADLRGVHSHGANLMALYVTRIRSGHIDPSATVRCWATTARRCSSTAGSAWDRSPGSGPPTWRWNGPGSAAWPSSPCGS